MRADPRRYFAALISIWVTVGFVASCAYIWLSDRDPTFYWSPLSTIGDLGIEFFPNNVVILLYGVIGRWLPALVVCGIIDVAFIFAILRIKFVSTFINTWTGAAIYLVISLITAAINNYIFFNHMWIKFH